MKMKSRFNNTGIGIAEDLTSARVKKLREAQATYGKRDVWTHDGKICADAQGKKIVVK